MIHRGSQRSRKTTRAQIFLAFAVAFFVSRQSEAGLVPVFSSSSATVTYSLNMLTAQGVSGAPQFTTDGVLLTPGGGLPALNGLLAGSPFQTAGTSSLANPFFSNSSTSPQNNANGTVPLNYGAATTSIYAQGQGQQGTSTTQGGVFWDSRTKLADNLSAGTTGLASVSFSTASATFVNTPGSGTIFILPASLLSVKGSVSGTAGSFVAAGLFTQITIGAQVINLTPIAEGASQSGLSVNSAGNGPNDSSSLGFSNGQLFATASSYFSGLIAVGDGQTITIRTSLTLISDPGSSIQLVTDLAPGFLPGGPFFGSSAGGPAFDSVTVPEPSTFVLMGVGLASLGAWRARTTRPRRIAA